MSEQQDKSLIAAIEGDFSGMAHGDLVLTCKMLTNGRAQWRKEAEELKAALQDSCKALEWCRATYGHDWPANASIRDTITKAAELASR